MLLMSSMCLGAKGLYCTFFSLCLYFLLIISLCHSMFSLKKKLGTAKVICKPPVLVPKTAQNSSLSKLGEMAHV